MTDQSIQHPGGSEGERAVTAFDPLDEVRAKILASIEQMKAGPNPRRDLQRLHKQATKTWATTVNQIRRANGMVDEWRASLGIEPKNDDAREFPNWVIDQIRKAMREVGA